jgi:hypothetical protein
VRVSAGSALRAVHRQATLEVVSRHHQALASVAAPWKVAATDDEDLIEAIERDGHPFALGCSGIRSSRAIRRCAPRRATVLPRPHLHGARRGRAARARPLVSD